LSLKLPPHYVVKYQVSQKQIENKTISVTTHSKK